MIGLVLVTHGRLADEFRSALEHVVGPQKHIATICIGPNDDMDRRRRDILDAARSVDTGAGVIILTDLFGGTPSNLAISIMDDGPIEVIAGMNLPMLVKLAKLRADGQRLPDAVRCAEEAGKKYIRSASHVLAGK